MTTTADRLDLVERHLTSLLGPPSDRTPDPSGRGGITLTWSIPYPVRKPDPVALPLDPDDPRPVMTHLPLHLPLYGYAWSTAPLTPEVTVTSTYLSFRDPPTRVRIPPYPGSSDHYTTRGCTFSYTLTPTAETTEKPDRRDTDLSRGLRARVEAVMGAPCRVVRSTKAYPGVRTLTLHYRYTDTPRFPGEVVPPPDLPDRIKSVRGIDWVRVLSRTNKHTKMRTVTVKVPFHLPTPGEVDYRPSGVLPEDYYAG